MTFDLPAASSFAPVVDSIFKSLLLLSTILSALVWVLIFYFCVKYRRGSPANRAGGYRKNIWIEWSLTGVMFAFGLGIFIWSAKTFHHMYRPPKSSYDVNVIAKQWMWVFHDANGKDQINYLKVPIGKPVRLIMTSEDVIHSFFIPAFRIKQDVLPGRYTSLWFTATQLGSFEVLCSQYCGMSHSQMRAVVEVVSQSDYENYLKDTTNQALQASNTSLGAQLYVKHSCHSCHDATPPIGPSLKGVFGQKVLLADGSSVLIDENYLRRAILLPNAEIVNGFPAVMPTFQGRLTEGELLSIINYIKAKR